MTTLKKDMVKALDEESFHDVQLVGTDGVSIPATKAILGIRSPVFQGMFFGNFQERNSDRVELKYPSLVIKVLVKYCYTDELDLDMIYIDDDHDDDVDGKTHQPVYYLTDKEAVLMVQLRDAANFFQLTNLHLNVTNELGDIAQSPQDDICCLCAILTELNRTGESEGEPLWDMLIILLQANPRICLLPGTSTLTHNKGIVNFPLLLVDQILSLLSRQDPFVAVQALQAWCRANPEVLYPPPPLPTTSDKKDDDAPTTNNESKDAASVGTANGEKDGGAPTTNNVSKDAAHVGTANDEKDGGAPTTNKVSNGAAPYGTADDGKDGDAPTTNNVSKNAAPVGTANGKKNGGASTTNNVSHNETKKQLQQIARGIPLEAIPPYQLAQIQPCPLFSKSHLYRAFVHHGVQQAKDVDAMKELTTSKRGYAHVTGAGVECLNGRYREDGSTSSYVKEGIYGKLLCNFFYGAMVNDGNY